MGWTAKHSINRTPLANARSNVCVYPPWLTDHARPRATGPPTTHRSPRKARHPVFPESPVQASRRSLIAPDGRAVFPTRRLFSGARKRQPRITLLGRLPETDYITDCFARDVR